MPPTRLRASYYQQFDADPALATPSLAMGGWREAEFPLSLEHTALVVMHAWEITPQKEAPGVWRSQDHMGRMDAILRDVFPPLLSAVRASPMKVYHVVGGSDYYSHLPGYQRVQKMSPAPDWWPYVARDPALTETRTFLAEHANPGKHNAPDLGKVKLDFAPQARPVGDEAVAAYGSQLYDLCRTEGINHLIYIGFAINWCLLTMPGGMVDMRRHGIMCSVIRQGVTALESKETAANEGEKQSMMWRVSVAGGLVFEDAEVIRAVRG
ncbi:MAG: hypothetical protein NTW19_02810 [Planctomycetota bacterium]|nr:hypothetical protein [Planctomycetota bacterium]